MRRHDVPRPQSGPRENGRTNNGIVKKLFGAYLGMTTMLCVLTKARAWSTTRFRTDVVIVLVLLGIVIVCWLPRFSGPIDLRWDGAVYYVLGTSLAEGKGYRLLNEPGDIQAIQYPPLLPAVIAAHQLILGTDDPVIVGRWLRASFFIMYAAFIFSSYALLRRYLPQTYAFPAILTVALN